MGTVTVASAALFFQRFFLAEKAGDGTFDAIRVAMACVWLSSKAREDSCRLRDIVNSFTVLKSGSGPDGQVLQMEAYWSLRDSLVLYEQAVLRAMAFDAEPTPAYSFL